MDDTQDMRHVPEGTVERPLVTFAIFAYNQEKYIREAIEGAFAQTYRPLEIILSDDCSTDQTFEIMQEMVGSARDLNGIVVRQTRSNCGTLLHVADVAKLARGNLLVLAAGDDISKPQRTEALVEAWLSSGAWGFSSKFDRIDEIGRVTGHNESVAFLSSPLYPLRHYFATRQNEIKIIHGATSAYDRRLFAFLDTQPQDYILSEDGALSVLLNLLNKDVRLLDDSLVCYRENDNSLTNGGKSAKITRQKMFNDELAIERFALSQANRCRLFLRLDEKYGASSMIKLDTARLREEMEKQLMRVLWRETSFSDRIRHLIKHRTFTELKCYLPRMLPACVFIAAKTFLKSTSRHIDALFKIN